MAKKYARFVAKGESGGIGRGKGAPVAKNFRGNGNARARKFTKGSTKSWNNSGVY